MSASDVTEYKRYTQSLALAGETDDVDSLLDEMDALWWDMTQDERDLVRQWLQTRQL
jgi:hypothetical protein